MENNRHTEDRSVFYGRGVTFGDVLLIVFIVLKLCHVIDWSWWWVLSPLWIGFIIVVVVIIVIAIAQRRD
jgi:hypothetical protein